MDGCTTKHGVERNEREKQTDSAAVKSRPNETGLLSTPWAVLAV
jgi:hypothetical protein